jgi:fumarylacetoacetase
MSRFPVFGVVNIDGATQVCARIGTSIIGLADLVDRGEVTLDDIDPACLRSNTLNKLLTNDREALHLMVEKLVAFGHDCIRQNRMDQDDNQMQESDVLCPFEPGDFVDFYSSYHHAVRSMEAIGVKSPEPPENWFAMPVGYHSRTATIFGPGATIRRPNGQRLTRNGPVLQPSKSLDYELELGFVTCGAKAHAGHIPPDDFEHHVFGVTLLNDWSARDLQGWEAKPLGPLLSKSFATQIGPWVVPLEALAHAREKTMPDVAALPYLRGNLVWAVDIKLQVLIETEHMRSNSIAPEAICQTNFKHMYWNMAQQLSHATVNGTIVRPADLFGSGTISGPDALQSGCLLERTMAGQEAIELSSGETRAWLRDGDRVILSGECLDPNGDLLCFGELSGLVTASNHLQGCK